MYLTIMKKPWHIAAEFILVFYLALNIPSSKTPVLLLINFKTQKYRQIDKLARIKISY